ncbi:MAG: ActS/PrrB/RegB family redox-sensitive histidine kinase [Pseudomonadota bacterium]
MPWRQDTFLPSRERRDWVRVRTLIYLRWLAALGQTTAVLAAIDLFGIDLRLDLCVPLIGSLVVFNLAAMALYPETKRLGHRAAALTLFFDLTQLAALLYVCGGLANPFAVMILAQTIIGATVLTLQTTAVLGCVSILYVLGLALHAMPLRRADGSILTTDPLLILGTAAALIISVLFLAGYARRVTLETFAMSEALTATQLALEREQKLTDLGGVVAAAAHELGTPLATIKLVSAELIEDLEEHPLAQADARLIREQADRCRDILAAMGHGAKEDAHLRYAPFRAVVAEAAAPHIERGIDVRLQIGGQGADEAPSRGEPDIPRRAEVIHGVRNLVQNAVDFSRTTVWIDLDWDESQLMLRVSDDGSGYPTDLIGRIGDPFVRRRGGRDRQADRSGYDGMGLGLFIAKTLLERTGARLTFANGIAPGAQKTAPVPSGAIVEVSWPRGTLDVPRGVTRGPLGANPSLNGAEMWLTQR